jgi:UDP-GlcNAc:undecaprenyl-phosphate GlcNAc-1-phosphate transferase
MWKLIYLYIFISSFISALMLVWLFRNLALNLNFLDIPQTARKIHTKATPLLGGIAMYLGFIFIIGLNLSLIHFLHNQGKLPAFLAVHFDGIKKIMPQILAIITTSSVLVFMGLVDDKKNLNPFFKLGIQILLASIVFVFGVRISLFISNHFLSWVITVVWIVGITNAFNLLDNMDGLSSGIALISALIFFLVAFLSNQFFVASILACFAGIMLGFLCFNFPPAKVFMGDAGSLFIGYTLSILTIVNTYYNDSAPTIAPVIMPLLIMAVPIFDTVSVITIRIKNKVSIFKADKNHLSHRLIKRGMSVRQALFFIYLTSLCVGIGALLLSYLDTIGCVLVLLQAISIIFLIVLLEGIDQ